MAAVGIALPGCVDLQEVSMFPSANPIPDQGQAGHVGRDRQGLLSRLAGQGWIQVNGGISALLRIPEAAGAFSP